MIRKDKEDNASAPPIPTRQGNEVKVANVRKKAAARGARGWVRAQVDARAAARNRQDRT
ncbi:MAG: hypothetical protein P4L42_02570 [Desulfocapsaceae bacterium]|nr:hypothetical protein [Desulfocapsaceae bacterium]